MPLRAEIRTVAAMDTPLRDAMYGLMAATYDGVCEAAFAQDLAAKDCAVLLFDGDRLAGFSTQVCLHRTIDGRALRIVFSGDTVVRPDCRRSWALPVAWCRMMRSLLRSAPDVPLYWLLITKGYRTYRYLPVFFNDFDPRPEHPWRAGTRRIAEVLGRELFKARYDEKAGVVRAEANGQRLKPDAAAVPAPRLRDPYIRFFLRANPGYERGDELLCLAAWSESNMKPFILERL